MRFLFGSTVPQTLDVLMKGQLAWLAEQGHEVHAVSSPGPGLDRIAAREGATTHAIPMEREISPAADVRALQQWTALLREIEPDVVVVGTPKAGLLGGLAARRTGVPRRVYLMRGARFEGATGVKRQLLRLTERVSAGSAHTVIAVSPSLAALAIQEGVVRPGKIRTVGAGSSNGVDIDRFHPPTAAERSAARERLGLQDADIAIAFVGRLHPDKGLEVLQQALAGLGGRTPGRTVLFVAGRQEGLTGAELAAPGIDVRMLGLVDDVPELLRASDMLVLPTQREGFPNVVLEASASGLPVVTTDATGAVDSVIDGVTGYVVPKHDGAALGRAMALLARDEQLRQSLGAAGRARVVSEFSNELVWEGMLDSYLGLDADDDPATG